MTPYSNIAKRFIRKIKKDKEFFCYGNVTEKELEEIVKQRTNDLLDDSVNELQLQVTQMQNISFLDKDDDLEQFNFDLTFVEEDLISDLMVVKYFEEELLSLKAMQKYLGNDIKVFSPARERKTFLETVQYKNVKFVEKLDRYNSTDRLTGKVLLAYE